MVGIAFLIALAVYAVFAAEDKERKLINLGIIVASIVAGFALAVLIGYIADASYERLAVIGIMLGGYLGVTVAGALNYWRSGGIYRGKKRRGLPSDKTVV